MSTQWIIARGATVQFAYPDVSRRARGSLAWMFPLMDQYGEILWTPRPDASKKNHLVRLDSGRIVNACPGDLRVVQGRQGRLL